MADMITADELRKFQAEHPGSLTVCYVNSTAEVKALSDYCCTSGNAVELVSRLPDDKEILFVPDKYLGAYVKAKTRRNLILWPGFCPTHAVIAGEVISDLKALHPQAIVMAHPECPESAKNVADVLLSTGQMLEYARKSEARSFIIATEPGILHALRKGNPDKKFFAASPIECFNMKKITLESLYFSLEYMQYEIDVPAEIASRARRSLDRMLEVLPATSARSNMP
jgi:quinolinate synthase